MVGASILVIAVSALIFMLLRTGERKLVRSRHGHANDRELWVARERLTAGEIDAEQYERIVHALSR
jgi:uncharacterized membrane protein